LRIRDGLDFGTEMLRGVAQIFDRARLVFKAPERRPVLTADKARHLPNQRAQSMNSVDYRPSICDCSRRLGVHWKIACRITGKRE
jgi:hypothetical protein